MHEKVAGSIPTGGTYLGCELNPQSMFLSHINSCLSVPIPVSFSVSVSLSPHISPSFSLYIRSINISLGMDYLKMRMKATFKVFSPTHPF